MSDPTPRIDHVLVNVNDRLDEAADRYGRMGFNLMPRGHHSVGSSNHLAIFRDDYFELLGYEPRNAARAAGLWGDVAGLSGLIMKTGDATGLAATLRARSIATVTDEPMALSRMVDLPGGTAREARFRSLHLDPSLTPAGMLLYCEHLTPELVWRGEWQGHANGVTAIAGIAVATGDPARSVGLMERIHGPSFTTPIAGGLRFRAGEAVIDYIAPGAAVERFGADLPLSPQGADRNVAITFAVSSASATRAVLKQSGIAHGSGADGPVLVPASSAFGVALVFAERPAAAGGRAGARP